MDIFAILIMVMGFPGVYMSTHQTVHFKYVHFTVHQLYLNITENKQKRVCVPPAHPSHTEDALSAFPAEWSSFLASQCSPWLELIPLSPPQLPPQAGGHHLTPGLLRNLCSNSTFVFLSSSIHLLPPTL